MVFFLGGGENFCPLHLLFLFILGVKTPSFWTIFLGRPGILPMEFHHIISECHPTKKYRRTLGCFKKREPVVYIIVEQKLEHEEFLCFKTKDWSH